MKYYKIYLVRPSEYSNGKEEIRFEITQAEYERLSQQPKQESFRVEEVA